MRRFRLMLFLAATVSIPTASSGTLLGLPVLAQAAAPPMTGDISIIDGADLEDALTSAVDEAVGQLSAGASFADLLTSPVLLLALFTVLGAVATYISTDGVKLTTLIKGKQTQLVAWLFAALSAGVPAYFGLTELGGIGGWRAVALAVLPTLGSFWGAHSRHEQKRQAETGMRKPEREAAKKRAKAQGADLVLKGLQAAALAVGIPPTTVTFVYEQFGRSMVEKMIARERAMTETEIKADQDQFEKSNPVVVPASGAGIVKPTITKPAGGVPGV